MGVAQDHVVLARTGGNKMAKLVGYICDICAASGREGMFTEINIPLVFYTEQTEGKGVAPYISNKKMEICQQCEHKLIDTLPIIAYGAQGYNEYKWRGQK